MQKGGINRHLLQLAMEVTMEAVVKVRAALVAGVVKVSDEDPIVSI